MTVTRPTATQYRVLLGIRDHGDPFHGCRGRSEFGGRRRSLQSVRNRNWVNMDPERRQYVLTPTGQEMI